MEKIWYIKIGNKEEGPYSIRDLRRNWRLTPDTLVRRQEWKYWKKARDVSELAALFVDDEPSKLPVRKKDMGVTPQEEGILDMRIDPPHMVWIFILILLLVYVWYVFTR